MELLVQRFSSQENSTLGNLFISDSIYDWQCFTLEDEKRTNKVFGETRIPAGKYEIKFKTTGSFHKRYLERYGSEWHMGMLEVTGVPNFTDILIHTGNTADDTAGCLLVGDDAFGNKYKAGRLQGSRRAYDRLYPIIRNKLILGERVFITYRNLDTI